MPKTYTFVNIFINKSQNIQFLFRLTHGKSTPPCRAARLLPISLYEIWAKRLEKYKQNKCKYRNIK